MRASYAGTDWVTLEAAAPHDQAIRFVRLFPPNLGGWHIQRKYVRGHRNEWRAARRRMQPEDVRRHLARAGDYWIATRSIEDAGTPATPFLILDFDAKGDTPSHVALERLHRVVEVIGEDVPPIVSTTPGGGYHALWFFDATVPLSSFVNLRMPQSAGPLPELIRYVLGASGSGICEVFPAAGQVVRMPFGGGQDVIDMQTGEVIGDLDALLTFAERYRIESARLTVNRIRSIRPSREVVPMAVASRSSLAGPREFDTQPVHSLTREEAVSLYEHGLVAKGTRNRATFALALTMVHDPEALVPLGFDPIGSAEEQLYEWLRAKHNGLSSDFPGPGEHDETYWREEMARVVASARTSGLFREIRARLTEEEWGRVFNVGENHAESPADRFNLEVLYASVLRKAKSSVLHRDYRQESSGTYPAEIKNEWWRQIRGCSHAKGLKVSRERLMTLGLLERRKAGDKQSRRGTIYALPLNFGGAQPELPASPSRLASISRHLQQDLPYVEYCFLIVARFPGAALAARYGSKAARRARRVVENASSLLAVAPEPEERDSETAG